MRALAILAALLVGAAPARAQPALTLRDAIRMADERNEGPRIAAARVREARAARRAALAALLPGIVVNGRYQRRARAVTRDVGGVEVVLQRRNALSATLAGDVTLIDPSGAARVRAAGLAADAAREDERGVRSELWLEVADSYFTALAAERVRDAAAHRVEVATLAEEAARRRFEADLTNRNAVTRSALETAQARSALAEAEGVVVTSRLALGHLLDDEVTGALVEPDAPLAATLPAPALVRDALRLRPDAAALRARLESARAAAREPWLRLAPRVDASVVADVTNETGFGGNQTDWTIAVTATWVLYDGGLRYADARAADAARDAVALELAALERRAGLEVRTALVELRTASSRAELAAQELEVARENAREVEARFEAGLSNALERADANQTVFDAEAGLARARLAVRAAEVALLRAAGTFPMGGPS